MQVPRYPPKNAIKPPAPPSPPKIDMDEDFKGYITYRCYKCDDKYCVVRIKAGEELPTVCPYLLIKCKWQKKGTEERYA